MASFVHEFCASSWTNRASVCFGVQTGPDYTCAHIISAYCRSVTRNRFLQLLCRESKNKKCKPRLSSALPAKHLRVNQKYASLQSKPSSVLTPHLFERPRYSPVRCSGTWRLHRHIGCLSCCTCAECTGRTQMWTFSTDAF